MERPVITTIDDKEHEMKNLGGRAWRITAEYTDGDFKFSNPALLETAAEYVAQFYDDVTVEDILDLPIEEILPTAFKIRDYVFDKILPKMEKIEKNSEEDKAQ